MKRQLSLWAVRTTAAFAIADPLVRIRRRKPIRRLLTVPVGTVWYCETLGWMGVFLPVVEGLGWESQLHCHPESREIGVLS